MMNDDEVRGAINDLVDLTLGKPPLKWQLGQNDRTLAATVENIHVLITRTKDNQYELELTDRAANKVIGVYPGISSRSEKAALTIAGELYSLYGLASIAPDSADAAVWSSNVQQRRQKGP